MTIAALYIDPRGPYPRMSAGRGPDNREPADPYARSWGVIDCWDAARDARLYAGPHPVVAHPACGPWGSLSHQYGGAEGGPELGIIAVEQVRKYGGVLEHPANSRLWEQCGLPRPKDGRDAFDGRTIYVEQVEWGHACRKPTWLYLVGVPDSAIEAPPFPGRAPTHWIGGGRNPEKAPNGRPGKRVSQCLPPGIKAASKEIRRRTPPLFAEYLVRLARAAQK